MLVTFAAVVCFNNIINQGSISFSRRAKVVAVIHTVPTDEGTTTNRGLVQNVTLVDRSEVPRWMFCI